MVYLVVTTWSGVFRLVKKERKYYLNGALQNTELLGYDSEQTTLSSWAKYQTVPVINSLEDTGALNRLINGNPDNWYTYRIKSISEQSYGNAITTYLTQTRCNKYPLTTSYGLTSGECNCSQSSIACWKLVTGESLSFGTPIIPLAIRNAILNTQNNQSMSFTKP
jgi:hypothetical protein